MRNLLLMLFALLMSLTAVPSQVTARSLDSIAQIYLKGDLETTIKELKIYLETKESDDTAWTILGNAHNELKQLDDAENAFRKSIAINGKNYSAYTGLGIVYRKREKYDQALAYYEQAVKINPNYAEAYSSMSIIALKKSQDDKAVEYAKKAYDMDQTNGLFAANLAAAYHYKGLLQLRDELTARAKQLGYKNGDQLAKIYSGELTLRE